MRIIIPISILLLFVWGCADSMVSESILPCDKEHQKNMDFYFSGVFDGLKASGLSSDKIKKIGAEIILTTVEKEFGRGYREAAIASAQKEVDEKGEAPPNAFAVYCLIRKHYRMAIIEEMERRAGIVYTPKQKRTRIDMQMLEELEQEVGYQSDGFGDLKINAYGQGVHMNQYGQPVKLKPDFGYVPGEQLQIKHDAYGPGVHMDQYGRPVREYPWP